MLDPILDYLFANDYICVAFALICLVLGFFAGVFYHKATNQNTLKDPCCILSQCPLLDKGANWHTLSYKKSLFFKPKIYHSTCEHYKDGICAKTNNLCELLKGYKADYFGSL